MALHLIKLCVGVDSVEELVTWQKRRLVEMKKRGQEVLLRHTTRQMPRRRDEILTGGSLYWVVRGEVACRQSILDLRARTDEEGIERCDICLSPETVRVDPRPHRPFQGWRYLVAADAPQDLGSAGEGGAEFPEALRRELRALGIL